MNRVHTTTIDVKLRKKDEFYSQYNDGKLSKDLAKYLKQEYSFKQIINEQKQNSSTKQNDFHCLISKKIIFFILNQHTIIMSNYINHT